MTPDVLGAIIAHRSKAIATKHEKATPGEVMIVTTQKVKDELRTIREGPDPNASKAIKRVIAQHGQQARDPYQ